MKENTIGIVGKNGTGKTRKILFDEVENLISENKNMLILDERLEYYNYFGKKLEDSGYKIDVINFKEPIKSTGWNPLSYISYLYNNDKVDKAIELTEKMGKVIFKLEEENIDPYWSNMATSYFVGIVLILLKIFKENKDGSAINFTSILQIMNDGELEYKNSTYLREYLKNINTLDPIYSALSPILFAPTETRGSILSVVKSKINLFFMRPELLKMFYNDNFHICDLTIDDRNDKRAVFVVNYKPLRTMTNILIEQVFLAINDNNEGMTFVLDGFDRLPEINEIDYMIDEINHSNGRMKLYITANNKEQLISLYSNKFIFSEIEKVIKLTDDVDLQINNDKYELPTLNEHEIIYFNFKKYFD